MQLTSWIRGRRWCVVAWRLWATCRVARPIYRQQSVVTCGPHCLLTGSRIVSHASIDRLRAVNPLWPTGRIACLRAACTCMVAYGPHCLPTGSMHMHGGLRAALLAYGQHAYAWHCLPTGSTRVVGCSARLRAAQGLWPKGCIARLRAAEGLQLMVPIACLRQHCLPIAADILAALRAYGQHVMQPAGSSYRMPHGASCLVNVIYIYIYVYIRHLYIRILKYIFFKYIYIYVKNL